MNNFAVHIYENDLPDGLSFSDSLALDCEMMGLNVRRDRLCLLQLCDQTGGDVHIVRFADPSYNCPNLKALLSDPSRQKIFYFARGDSMWIKHYLGVTMENLYCLKIASRLVRTYARSHELEDVCSEILGVKMSKQQQSSDWGCADLNDEQLRYAAHDVIYLHELRDRLDDMLNREGRKELAYETFSFLPVRTRLDLAGWRDEDIFSYFIKNIH